MRYSPEKIIQLAGEVKKKETRERARAELANLLALVAGFKEFWFSGADEGEEVLKKILNTISETRRIDFLQELKAISEEVGWKIASEILESVAHFEKSIRKIIRVAPDVELYPHLLKRPDDIREVKDFFGPEREVVNYWIPRKFDIRRTLRVAEVVHKKAQRSGLIRILDVGGGPGFLGKLLADEARFQDMEVEVVVVDPNKKTIDEARELFSDTPNLSFDVATAYEAVLKYGPELSAENKKIFIELERKRRELIEKGGDELKLIKSILKAMELSSHPDQIIAGPFGKTATRVFVDASIDIMNSPDIEEIRNAVADYYNDRLDDLRSQLENIRSEQEKIMSQRDERTASFDLVVNSWMPVRIDFTREIRWLGAPAILYALTNGATGVEHVGPWPEDFGQEQSYETGKNYKSYPDLEWEEISANDMEFEVDDSGRFPYKGIVYNIFNIQTRRNINISKRDLALKTIQDDEKYLWEKDVERYVGKENVEMGRFSWRSLGSFDWKG